jgi:AraC-like DNA-binding protein
MDDLLSDKFVCDILLDPGGWRVVSSLFTPDIQPLEGRAFRRTLDIASHHYDAFPQVCIFLRGSGEFCLGNTVYLVAPRTVFFVDAFERHAYCSFDPTMPREMYQISILPGYYVAHRAHMEGLDSLQFNRDDIFTNVEAGVLLDRLWEALRQSHLGSTLARTRLIAATAVVASTIAERCLWQERKSPCDFQREVIEAIKQHIVGALGHKHSLAELARVAGYSKSHFCRLFRQETHQSVHEFIDICRLARAQELKGKGSSQTQISTALGFSTLTAYVKWRRTQRTRGEADALKYFTN